MVVTAREESGCTVGSVAGRLDAATAPVFEKAFEEWIGKGTKRLVLDLSALDDVSSAGLRAILSKMKKLKAAGGGIAVTGLSGFDSLLPVGDSVAGAIASL
jgi:anti-anti-sigma factor